jgi:hypothetical protein
VGGRVRADRSRRACHLGGSRRGPQSAPEIGPGDPSSVNVPCRPEISDLRCPNPLAASEREERYETSFSSASVLPEMRVFREDRASVWHYGKMG